MLSPVTYMLMTAFYLIKKIVVLRFEIELKINSISWIELLNGRFEQQAPDIWQ